MLKVPWWCDIQCLKKYRRRWSKKYQWKHESWSNPQAEIHSKDASLIMCCSFITIKVKISFINLFYKTQESSIAGNQGKQYNEKDNNFNIWNLKRFKEVETINIHPENQ